ncbi:MAG: hypothetical protein D6741_08310, partial [Planctomycetota bacterium]
LKGIADRCAQRKPPCRLGPVGYSVWDDPTSDVVEETLRGELLKMLAGEGTTGDETASDEERPSGESDNASDEKVVFSTRDEAVVRALQLLNAP